MGRSQSRRLDPTTVRTFAPGDLLAILAFLLVGEFSHGFNPLVHPVHFLNLAVQFFVGWVVVAPIAGAYAGHVADSARRLALVSALAWVGADVVAQLLRSLSAFEGTPALSFFFVSTFFGGALLLAARLVSFRLR